MSFCASASIGAAKMKKRHAATSRVRPFLFLLIDEGLVWRRSAGRRLGTHSRLPKGVLGVEMHGLVFPLLEIGNILRRHLERIAFEHGAHRALGIGAPSWI